MDEQVLGWLRQLSGKAGLDSAAAARIVRALQLPQDYAAFLREHDGAEGFIGESYARLYGSSDFTEEAASPPLEHLADLIVFGSNGAGEVYAFDGERVVVVPWIGDTDDAIPQGSFVEFVRRLHAGRIFDRD